MANREACELWIEQEIESGLEEGKTPYSIGKELSAMVERVFETKIKPATLEKRAERFKELPTFVGKTNNPALKRPKCRICDYRLIELDNRTKRPKENGLCHVCRKQLLAQEQKAQALAKAKDELGPEGQAEREAGWAEINQKLAGIVNLMRGRKLFPIIISDHLKGELKKNMRWLNDCITLKF